MKVSAEASPAWVHEVCVTAPGLQKFGSDRNWAAALELKVRCDPARVARHEPGLS